MTLGGSSCSFSLARTSSPWRPGSCRIEEHDADIESVEQVQGLFTVSRGPDDADIPAGLQHADEALAHDGAILDDEHGDDLVRAVHERLLPHDTGTTTSTVVPLPGADETRTMPPATAACSLIMERP